MTLTATHPSSAIPVTQNTAPVKEFRCLYTHDLRRKAKRWQDGFLRYHTFNRRIMVYDVARNFIGDTYNRSGVELEDGDELDLEKDFALVQVSEPLGVTQTDLTELMQSRQRKDLPSPAAARRPNGTNNAPQPSLAAIQIPRNTASKRPANATPSIPEPSASAERHRSLSALLGPAKGPLGKAVLPILSPFEERQKRLAAETHDVERPSKKPRKSTSEKRCDPSKRSPPRVTLPAPIRRPATTPSHPKQIVDLCSEEESPGLFSSIVRARKDLGFAASILGKETEKENFVQSPTAGKESAPATQSRFFSSAEDEEPIEARKTLRVVSNAPRKMLLCQQPPPRKRTASPAVKPTAHQKAPAVQPAKARTSKSKDVQSHRLHVELAPSHTESPGEPLIPPSALSKEPLEHVNESRTESEVPSVPAQAVLPRVIADTGPSKGATVVTSADVPNEVEPVAPPARPRSAMLRQTTAAKLTRTVSAGHVGPPVAASPAPPPKPVLPLDYGPWSREAQDLFDWWPPDRDRAGNKLTAAVT